MQCTYTYYAATLKIEYAVTRELRLFHISVCLFAKALFTVTVLAARMLYYKKVSTSSSKLIKIDFYDMVDKN